MIRLSAALAVVVAAAILPRAARAEVPSFFVDQRVVVGVEDVRGLSLGIVGAGARWRPTATMDVQVEAITLRSAGGASSGEPAPFGVGGEASLRVAPWDARRPVRPFLGAGLGLVAFPSSPFLPGGVGYEGLVTFSVGAETRLGSHLTAGVSAFSAHLSNGQGLGPHNPAYDGYGGALEITWSPSSGSEAKYAETSKDHRSGRESPWPGVVVDAEGGRFGEAAILAARLRIPQRLSPALLTLLDAEGGTADALAIGEIGAALAMHVGLASLGVYGAFRGYAGAQIGVATLQAEGHLTRELSLVAMGHYEDSVAFGRTLRAAVGGRAFPTEDLAIDLGVGFDRIGDDLVFGGDRADPYLGVEWRVPWRPLGAALSLFLERQVSTLDILGARVCFDAGRSPYAFARHDGWRRLR